MRQIYQYSDGQYGKQQIKIIEHIFPCSLYRVRRENKYFFNVFSSDICFNFTLIQIIFSSSLFIFFDGIIVAFFFMNYLMIPAKGYNSYTDR